MKVSSVTSNVARIDPRGGKACVGERCGDDAAAVSSPVAATASQRARRGIAHHGQRVRRAPTGARTGRPRPCAPISPRSPVVSSARTARWRSRSASTSRRAPSASPDLASAATSSSLSVTPPSAETTTTGAGTPRAACSLRDDRGHAADGVGGRRPTSRRTSSRASASLALAQPARPRATSSSAFSTAAPAAPRIGVVAEREELVVEHGTRAQPSDGHRHAAVAVDVEPRLRAILLGQVDDRLRRRRRQLERLRRAAEAGQRVRGLRRARATARARSTSTPCDRSRPARASWTRSARPDAARRRSARSGRGSSSARSRSCSSSPPMNGTTLPTDVQRGDAGIAGAGERLQRREQRRSSGRTGGAARAPSTGRPSSSSGW